MSTGQLSRGGSRNRIRHVSRTDSEIACEEAARLTAELQDEQIEDDEEYEYREMPPPPDGGYGWVIVLASFLCNLVVDGIAYTFGIFLPVFVEQFKVDRGTVAWVGSLLTGMYLTVGPIVSALCNKFGCRAVCIAGSIMASVAFVLSTFSTSVWMLMVVYGVIGGIGFGMIYLPAVVAVGYYFETKRSLATGIAVCGSGVGTFVFAPLATFLLENFDWKNSLLILAGLILNCAIFGALMRPLTYPKEDKGKPLMQRMYEEKRMQMERGSIVGSYFMVQLPDGTMEKRMKLPLNADPGVHSSLALDQLAQGMHPVATLPTISESRGQGENGNGNGNGNGHHEEDNNHTEMKKQAARHRNRVSESDANELAIKDNIPRNASQPAFTAQQPGIPKNGSVPTFNRTRKTSQSDRFQPSLGVIKASSRGDMGSNGEVRQKRYSRGSIGSKYSDDFDFNSKSSLHKTHMVRPMSRKDIFYSGSVTNLKEYQSQKSLTNYRNSVVSLTKYEKDHRHHDTITDVESGSECDPCPCVNLPPSFKSALSSMVDVSLLKDPAFMFIGISNVFGMAALYVPFVYLVDFAVQTGIEKEKASFLLSIIGIINTFCRIILGYIADFPKVDSLLLNNICLVIATFSVGLTPLCTSYAAYVAVASFFAIAISGYISLTSIILVDLLGLEKLTNAFGLLILFRGFAALIGSPVAGFLYDSTKSYDAGFYVAGVWFGLSALFSFLAPVVAKCRKPEEEPLHVEVLTPIDEEADENEGDDHDQDPPITMIPKIIQTAPSPSLEILPSLPKSNSNSTNKVNNISDDSNTIKTNGTNSTNEKKEISQMESVL